MSEEAVAATEVAAAILLREGADGHVEYLLARRPPGKVYAGYWEFPGGKVEPGESMRQALLRELQEELGIDIERAWPWLSRCFTYPHARVRLKFFRVLDWRGELVPHEHDGVVWVRIGSEPEVAPVLPANGPILRALALPPEYVLTNAANNGPEIEAERLRQALATGLRLIRIGDQKLASPQRLRFAREVMAFASRYHDARVLIVDDEALASAVGAHGLHLSAERLMQAKQRPPFEWVAASCRGAEELGHAAALGVDFAVLGPVLPAPGGGPGIGWEGFARMIEPSPLPVFAGGGIDARMLDTARSHGAHGIATDREERRGE